MVCLQTKITFSFTTINKVKKKERLATKNIKKPRFLFHGAYDH